MAIGAFFRRFAASLTGNSISDAEALAQFIVGREQYIVFLLENHTMEIPLQLADEGPRQILKAAGFRGIYSESSVDAGKLERRLRPEIKSKLDELEGQNKPEPNASELRRKEREKELLKNNGEDFFYRPVGTSLISFQEALSDFDQKYGTKSLVRGLLLYPFRSIISPGAPIAEVYVVVDEWLAPCFDDDKLGKVLDEILASKYTQNLVNRLKKGGETDKTLKTQLIAEWRDLENELRKKRLFGKSDQLSAMGILKTLQPADRAIVIYGLDHGLVANNPASIPDQIISQALAAGRTDTSIGLIALTTPSDTEVTYRSVAEFAGENRLRREVQVYDFKLRKAWPVSDWFANAPAIYPKAFRHGRLTRKSPLIEPGT